MQVIWKEIIRVTDEYSMQLPKGATILCLQMQDGVPCIWFLVPDLPVIQKEIRTFVWYNTGHIKHIEGTYIGTIQLDDGAFVSHLFETTHLKLS